MGKPSKSIDGIDHQKAAGLLEEQWEAVVEAETKDAQHNFVADKSLRSAISQSVNHDAVTYRFCLPTQLLGKLCQPLVK